MVSEKLVIVLITIAILLSVASVAFTLSTLSDIHLVKTEVREQKVVIEKNPVESGNVGLAILSQPEEVKK